MLEKQLGIQTERPAAPFPANGHYYRYEPTPYPALGALLEQVGPRPGDWLVDFGCGCGRVGCMASLLCGMAATGVEMDQQLLGQAWRNRAALERRYPRQARRLEFVHALAQSYGVEPGQTVFYFFNPFSPQVFGQVVRNILASWQQAPRAIELWLYYPSVEYVYFLEYQTPFALFEQIPLAHLWPGDPRECFYLYRLP